MGQTGPISDDDGPAAPGSASHAADRARDAELVTAARAGDPDAFGRLYDAWFDRVHALVVRIVRDRDIAEEVCQDCFLTAWRSLDGLRDPASFGGWLLRIARNRSYDRAGTEARSTPVDDGGLAVIEGTGSGLDAAPTGLEVGARLSRAERPEVAAQDAEIAALVREATAALSERDAEALDLQLRYELTPAEIGEVMGINRNAANQLCHRARARFATAFGARMLWRGLTTGLRPPRGGTGRGRGGGLRARGRRHRRPPCRLLRRVRRAAPAPPRAHRPLRGPAPARRPGAAQGQGRRRAGVVRCTDVGLDRGVDGRGRHRDHCHRSRRGGQRARHADPGPRRLRLLPLPRRHPPASRRRSPPTARRPARRRARPRAGC